jgi:type IV pilus assembly protein PilB
MLAGVGEVRTMESVALTTTPALGSDVERAVAVLSLEHRIIEPAKAAAMIRQARSDTSRTLSSLLLELAPEESILRAIATERGIRYFDPFARSSEFTFDEMIFNKADSQLLRRFSALPLRDQQGRVVVAVGNPDDLEMLDYLRSRYSQFLLVLSPHAQIQNRLAFYASADVQIPALQSLAGQAPITPLTPTLRTAATNRSPVQEWLDMIFERAVAEAASDVHFMIQADGTLLLRLRIDGILRQQRVPAQIRPIEVIGSIVTRCPTMDSANFREPQDGTFSFEAAGRMIDARVALLPQSYGPTVVVRLLDSLSIRARLDTMGFSPAHLELMRGALQTAQGTIFAVGPTGSGKSTTLYGMLREVDAAEKCVLTVEDPIEYRLPLIGQTEIRDGLGDRSITFARALRAILRLDPDVILVGEVRDRETAEVTMQAAITGHLVLSTLHATNSLSTFTRLSNMGVPPYLVAEAASLVISQRLLRKVHECAEFNAPGRDEAALLESMGVEPPPMLARAVGCPACSGSGYRGRIAAVEVFKPTPDTRALLLANASQAEVTEQALVDGFVPLLHDGIRHVRAGLTTLSEVLRTVAFDTQRESRS